MLFSVLFKYQVKFILSLSGSVAVTLNANVLFSLILGVLLFVVLEAETIMESFHLQKVIFGLVSAFKLNLNVNDLDEFRLPSPAITFQKYVPLSKLINCRFVDVAVVFTGVVFNVILLLLFEKNTKYVIVSLSASIDTFHINFTLPLDDF